jgi:hypothetical protein
MRLQKQIVTDHDFLQDINEDDHHLPVTYFTVAINSQSVNPASAYEVRIDLGNSGHKTIRVILRGNTEINIQGYEGCFVLGTDVSEECSSFTMMKYSATYITSYMGGYSRIHGDSYLSRALFGEVFLRDVYIDGDEAVLEFYNTNASQSKNLTVYGTGVVK